MKVYLVMADLHDYSQPYVESIVLSVWDNEQKAQDYIDRSSETISEENENDKVSLRIESWKVG